jgi:hypothetical protein
MSCLLKKSGSDDENYLMAHDIMDKNKIYHEYNSIVELTTTDFCSSIAKFSLFLKFIAKNQKVFNNNLDTVIAVLITIDNIVDSSTNEGKLYFDLLTNKKIRENIIKFKYFDNVSDVLDYNSLNETYNDITEYINLSDESDKLFKSSANIQMSSGLVSICDKQVTISGFDDTTTSRVMSRSNSDFKGLKTVNFEFNPYWF